MPLAGMRQLLVLLVLAPALAVASSPAPAASPLDADALARLAALEAQVLRELNRVRAARGLRPLRPADPLRAAAASHSRAMLRTGFFDHDSPDGTSFADRLRRFYPDRGWERWSVGETLLAGSEGTGARAVVGAWLDSPPHREIILSASWREAGIGAFWASPSPPVFGGGPAVVVTADFGARSGRGLQPGSAP